MFLLMPPPHIQLSVSEKSQNLRRLEAQRNELNAKGSHTTLAHSVYVLVVRLLREELQLLQEQGSHVGEVIKAMDKKKVLVKVLMSVCEGLYIHMSPMIADIVIYAYIRI